MSTTALGTKHAVGTPAPLPHTPSGTTTLVLMAFAAVYVVWGSTYLAIRIGVESFPPLILAGLRHVVVGILLYPIFSLQDRDPTERHTLAHCHCRRSIAAIRWKWRGELGRTDCTLWNHGTPGGDSVTLAGGRGLAPSWRCEARSQGDDGSANGICGN